MRASALLSPSTGVVDSAAFCVCATTASNSAPGGDRATAEGVDAAAGVLHVKVDDERIDVEARAVLCGAFAPRIAQETGLGPCCSRRSYFKLKDAPFSRLVYPLPRRAASVFTRRSIWPAVSPRSRRRGCRRDFDAPGSARWMPRAQILSTALRTPPGARRRRAAPLRAAGCRETADFRRSAGRVSPLGVSRPPDGRLALAESGRDACCLMVIHTRYRGTGLVLVVPRWRPPSVIGARTTSPAATYPHLGSGEIRSPARPVGGRSAVVVRRPLARR